jgi:serine/threonine protein phosphatase 1
MSQIVQRFKPNLHGRDFVVGDIHGCFEQLRAALQDVRFAPDRDRLFAVGDLIDRGPRSAEALEWLARPCFHACIGNHEDMALRALHDDHILYGWTLLNGGEWWLTLDEEQRQAYLSAFRQLPVAMEVATAQGRVGIVHADVPEGLAWGDFVDALETGDTAARETAVWSRRRADGQIAAAVDGVDRVVCGHTITADRRIHRHANVWFIDTGAFLSDTQGGHLTLLALERLFGPWSEIP